MLLAFDTVINPFGCFMCTSSKLSFMKTVVPSGAVSSHVVLLRYVVLLRQLLF